jgi:hypothetical protein
MASITLEDDQLVVHLTLPEKLASLHRDVRVPSWTIQAVGVETQPLRAVRGLRALGLSIPARTKIGTWRRYCHRGFVVARRDMPAVSVRLARAEYDDLLVSVPDVEAAASAIRRHWQASDRG